MQPWNLILALYNLDINANMFWQPVFYLMCQSSFSILFNKSKVLDRIMYNQTDAFMED